MQLAAKTSNFIQRAWGADENSDGDDSSVDGYVLMVCFCFKFTPSGYIGLKKKINLIKLQITQLFQKAILSTSAYMRRKINCIPGDDQEGVSRLSHVLRQKKFWFCSRYYIQNPNMRPLILSCQDTHGNLILDATGLLCPLPRKHLTAHISILGTLKSRAESLIKLDWLEAPTSIFLALEDPRNFSRLTPNLEHGRSPAMFLVCIKQYTYVYPCTPTAYQTRFWCVSNSAHMGHRG